MKMLRLVAACALLLLVAGCGSASKDGRSDGTAFTLYGFFADIKGETGLVGTSVSLSGTSSKEKVYGTTAFFGLQNNLTGQSLSLSTTNLSFKIVGGSVNPPDTKGSIPGVLGPIENGTDKTDPNTSLPSGFVGGKLGSSAFSEAALVPVDTHNWLVINEGLLPARPFTLQVTASVTAVSNAGDDYTTNSSTIDVVVVD